MRWMLLGVLVALSGCGPGMTRTEKAAKYAKDALELHDRGETTEAIELFRKSLENQPDWVKVRFDLGRLLYVLGQTHFDNHRAYDSLARDAREAGDREEAEKNSKKSGEERALADPLLDEAVRTLEVAVSSSDIHVDVRYNAYLLLAHTHVNYEGWQNAKKYYEAAREVADPGTDLWRRADEAVHLVDRELDRQAQAEIGPPPE